MATGTSLFQVMSRWRMKVFTRQMEGEPSMIQGDWKMQVCRLETTLMTQSQTIRLWIRFLSFLEMLTPAHRLTTKVTSAKEIFVKK